MPIVFHKQIDEFTELGVWKVEESERQLLNSLQLKQHERDLIESLGGEKRKLHWLSTRVLLRNMLNTQDYIDCRIDEHGKPYLLNSNTHISLSHSFDYAAVIIGKNKQVGIDIELVKHKIKAIKHKFLSDLELAQKQIGDNVNGLYVCWCAKEAIYKWYGKKGLEFKTHIRIKPFKLGEKGSLKAIVKLPRGTQEVTVHYFKIQDNYILGYVAP